MYEFDLDGGRPCLDFANTLSASTGEHLTAYPDLVDFAEQSALISPTTADWLRGLARDDPAAAHALLERAYRLRAVMYAIFSAVAAGLEAEDEDVDVLNDEFAQAMVHARVLPDGEGAFVRGWGPPTLETPLWEIIRSAAEVLVSDQERQRVRECGGDDCRWLFLDTSKNRSRQWCSMQSCGNRQKARRHYQRVRTASRKASAANTGSTS